jgi:anaerobic selenocysteine-containing dehydrogenase
VFVKDEQVVQIEGDPDSPISRGRLCPKGSASKSLVTSPQRLTEVRYRRPYATDWEDLDLDVARCGARSASPASAGRRSTTRRTTSSRSCSSG